MPLTIGTRLGPYEIVAPIGAGGMGEVYRAKDTRLDREVAIKVLHAAVAQDRERLARFEREAKVLASLNHPNIAQIYGLEEEGDTRALVMELVVGSTLSIPQPIDTALSHGKQIADALEAAHEKGITHRDLKPANIMITTEGVAKVLDFGLASVPSREGATDAGTSPTMTMAATQAGLIMGTAAYMSPEQAAGKAVDKRADIWAFGVVLYEMLAGVRMFAGESVADTLAAVMRAPLDLGRLPQETPAAIRTLIERCLERKVRDRLRDIGEARLVIDRHLSNPRQDVAAPIGRRTIPVWAIAAGLVVLAAIPAAIWLHGSAVRPLARRFELPAPAAYNFSPDGRWIISSRDGYLKLRKHDDTEWRLLPGTDSATFPFWSDDSSYVGFFSDGRLKSVSVEGADLRNLAAAPEPRGGTWRGRVKDGVLVFVSAGRLHRFDFATRQEQDLPVPLPQGGQVAFPVFLPEGDQFVYQMTTALQFGTNDEAFGVYRSSLSAISRAPVKLVDTSLLHVTFVRHPHTGAWHMFYVVGRQDVVGYSVMTAPIDPRTGDLKAEPVRILSDIGSFGTTGGIFDTAAGGMILWRRNPPSIPMWRLRWTDRNGNTLSTLGDPGHYASIALSPDETRLVVEQGYPNKEIWTYNLQRGSGARLSSEPGYKTSPVWSRDGRWIYYVSRSDTKHSIVRREADGGGVPQVLYLQDQGGYFQLDDVTPDGRYLLGLVNGRRRARTIFRFDLSGSVERPALESLTDAVGASLRITLDGHRLLIGTGSLSTTGYTLRYPPRDGETALPIPNFVQSLFFSKDGKTLYGVANHPNVRFMSAIPIFTEPSGSVRFGEKSSLFPEFTVITGGSKVGAVTQDGQRFLIITTDTPELLNIQVLTDWTTLLPGVPASR